MFYDEIDSKAGHYGIRRIDLGGFRLLARKQQIPHLLKKQVCLTSRTGYIPDTSAGYNPQGERVFKNMVDVYDGILKEDCGDSSCTSQTSKNMYKFRSKSLSLCFEQCVRNVSHFSKISL